MNYRAAFSVGWLLWVALLTGCKEGSGHDDDYMTVIRRELGIIAHQQRKCLKLEGYICDMRDLAIKIPPYNGKLDGESAGSARFLGYTITIFADSNVFCLAAIHDDPTSYEPVWLDTRGAMAARSPSMPADCGAVVSKNRR